MKVELEEILPHEIERRSFELITNILGERKLDPEQELVIKRVIHTTADFDYVDNLCFSEGAVTIGIQALESGASIITDTNMVKSGINQKVLHSLGGQLHCFMAEEEIREAALVSGTTRAAASMNKGASMGDHIIFAVGNAPTALIRLYELIAEGKIRPRLIIGVPVGFVNVIQSKELIMGTKIPYIVAKGRKGGSNVAASICNALLYQTKGNDQEWRN